MARKLLGLIEDDPGHARGTKYHLERILAPQCDPPCQIKVLVYPSREEVCRSLCKNSTEWTKFDLISVDLHLAETKDGFSDDFYGVELIHLIRERRPKARMLLVSDKVSEERGRRLLEGLNAGMTDRDKVEFVEKHDDSENFAKTLIQKLGLTLRKGGPDSAAC